jgi:putative membrane protein
MLNIIGKLIVNIIALLVVEFIIPGFELVSLEATIVAAVVIGVINTFIRPIIQILALPFSIVTLGIAAFLINVGLLMLAAAIVPGFEIDGFLTAAVSSIVLSLVGAFLHKLSK